MKTKNILSVALTLLLTISLAGCEQAVTNEAPILEETSASELVSDEENNTVFVEEIPEEVLEENQDIIIEDSSEATLLTLEEYYSIPENLKALDDEIASITLEYAEYYSKIKCIIVGNTVHYCYYYVPDLILDLEALNSNDWATLCKECEDTVENETGIRPDQVCYSYYNYDQSLIYGNNGTVSFTYLDDPQHSLSDTIIVQSENEIIDVTNDDQTNNTTTDTNVNTSADVNSTSASSQQSSSTNTNGGNSQNNNRSNNAYDWGDIVVPEDADIIMPGDMDGFVHQEVEWNDDIPEWVQNLQVE